MEFEGCTIPK
jgi:hypothetical protein